MHKCVFYVVFCSMLSAVFKLFYRLFVDVVQMFVVKNAGSNGAELNEFEISGSTYEPVGDVTLGGQSVQSSSYTSLVELANICALCNDSSLDYNEVRSIAREVSKVQNERLFITNI